MTNNINSIEEQKVDKNDIKKPCLEWNRLLIEMSEKDQEHRMQIENLKMQSLMIIEEKEKEIEKRIEQAMSKKIINEDFGVDGGSDALEML